MKPCARWTDTSADDVGGMLASVAIVTARGGRTSHAAVVARGIGRTCVAGVEGLVIDLDARTALCPGGSIKEGDTISVDGTTGKIFRGALAVRQSQVAELLGERAVLVEHVVLGDESDRTAALADIEELAHADFLDILRARDGLPVVVRLMDPPLHECLPDLTERSVEVALNNAPGGVPDPQATRRLAGFVGGTSPTPCSVCGGCDCSRWCPSSSKPRSSPWRPQTSS